MKAKDAVVCPKCGALNRPSWPFCARCSESLEGAQAAPESAEDETPKGTAKAKRPVIQIRAGAGPRGSSGLFTVLALLVVVGGGAWAWRAVTRAPGPAPVDPAAFTMGTLATELVQPSPRTDPGGKAYDEARRAMASGDVTLALAKFTAAISADPENAEYHNAYAYALWKSGDRAAALREQSDATRLDPRLRISYARMLEGNGDRAGAVREFEAVLGQMPEAATVHQELGRMLFRSGDYAKAAAHLQQAAAALPGDAVLVQELAYALDQTGDRAKAVEVYRGIVERSPWAGATRAYLSESLYEQGKKDEAIAVIREGITVSPNQPQLQKQLGRLLALEGRTKDAYAAYKTYLDQAPNAPDAKEVAEKMAQLQPAAEGAR